MNQLPLYALAGALATCLVATTSCSTTRGFGQDLKKLGHRIENEAESTGGTVPDATTRTTTTIYTQPAPVTPPPPSYPPLNTTPPGY
ncbi:MAG: entericidin A/B family lipoprotein [Verrucomicrobiota bacterium]